MDVRLKRAYAPAAPTDGVSRADRPAVAAWSLPLAGQARRLGEGAVPEPGAEAMVRARAETLRGVPVTLCRGAPRRAPTAHGPPAPGRGRARSRSSTPPRTPSTTTPSSSRRSCGVACPKPLAGKTFATGARRPPLCSGRRDHPRAAERAEAATHALRKAGLGLVGCGGMLMRRCNRIDRLDCGAELEVTRERGDHYGSGPPRRVPAM
jgi:hypothetical protein